MLDPQPGERVLDLCAAPGDEDDRHRRPDGEPRRRGRGRAGSGAGAASSASSARGWEPPASRVIEGDAAELDLGGGYDRVLVDPPCSDLGTLASRPDARWRKSPELIERVAGVQAAILDRAVDALRPGGTLVYSTCTISRREGEDRIAPLVARGGVEAADLAASAPELASTHDARFLQLRPDRDRHRRLLHRAPGAT